MTVATKRVLVIDDDPVFCQVLVRALVRRGFFARCANDSASALAAMSAEPAQWVVLDLNIAGESGLALIGQLLQSVPHCRIVVLTGYASIATAVEAIKLGAHQYLAKPADVDTILAAFNSEVSKASSPLPIAAPMSVARLEWEHIQRVLQEHGGNISATARALNMHRRTLQRKLGKKPSRA